LPTRIDHSSNGGAITDVIPSHSQLSMAVLIQADLRGELGLTRHQLNGRSDTTFSYPVVARRRDLPVERFAKVVVPQLDARELRKTPKAIKRVARADRRAMAVRRNAERLPVARAK
jgi:hypothetical protein